MDERFDPHLRVPFIEGLDHFSYLRSGGVYSDERESFHIGRYEDVVNVLSSRKLVPERKRQGLISTLEAKGLHHSIVHAFLSSILSETVGQRYRTLRNTLTQPINRQNVDQFSTDIRQGVDAVFTDLEQKQQFDLVSDLVAPVLDAVVLDALLGVPESHWDSIKRSCTNIGWSIHLLDQRFAEATYDRLSTQLENLGVLFEAMLSDHARMKYFRFLEESGCSYFERIGFYYGVVTSYQTSAASMIGNSLWLLSKQDDYRTQPDLGLFLQESIRMMPPATVVGRIVQSQTRIARVDAQPGNFVWVWLGSANRDERAFNQPQTFCPNAASRRNLSFGAGIFFCPFSALMNAVGIAVLERTQRSHARLVLSDSPQMKPSLMTVRMERCAGHWERWHSHN